MVRVRLLSALGGPTVRTPLAITIAVLLVLHRRWRQAAMLLLGVGGASISNSIIKEIAARERPVALPRQRQAGGYSFPSGHAAGSTVFFGLLAYLLWDMTRRRSIAATAAFGAAALAVLVGRSRVWLRAHHTTDVVAGHGVGLTWLLLVLRLFHRA